MKLSLVMILLDWFGRSWDWVAVLTGALAIVTATVAFATWRMMAATQKLALSSKDDAYAQFTPFVAPVIDQVPTLEQIPVADRRAMAVDDLILVVTNFGNGPALNVRLHPFGTLHSVVTQPVNLPAPSAPVRISARLTVPQRTVLFTESRDCTLVYTDLANREHRTDIVIRAIGPGGQLRIISTRYVAPPQPPRAGVRWWFWRTKK